MRGPPISKHRHSWNMCHIVLYTQKDATAINQCNFTYPMSYVALKTKLTFELPWLWCFRQLSWTFFRRDDLKTSNLLGQNRNSRCRFSWDMYSYINPDALVQNLIFQFWNFQFWILSTKTNLSQISRSMTKLFQNGSTYVKDVIKLMYGREWSRNLNFWLDYKESRKPRFWLHLLSRRVKTRE